jgi:hypothetical protein
VSRIRPLALLAVALIVGGGLLASSNFETARSERPVAASETAKPNAVSRPAEAHPQGTAQGIRDDSSQRIELIVQRRDLIAATRQPAGQGLEARSMFRARPKIEPEAQGPKASTAPSTQQVEMPFVYFGRRFDGGVWQALLRDPQGQALIVAQGEPLAGGFVASEVSQARIVLTHVSTNQAFVLDGDWSK